MNKLQTVRDALEYEACCGPTKLNEALAIVDELMAQEPVAEVTEAYLATGVVEWNPHQGSVIVVGTKLYVAPVAVQAVPAGFVLVPVEPTPEMVNAGRTTPMPSDSEWDEDDDYRAVYKAMLAAAPVAKGEV